MLKRISNFIVTRLDLALKATSWINITGMNIVGNLATSFAVYQRSRPLVSVLNRSSNEFSKYQSLQDIMMENDTFLVACDSEWVSLENPDGSHNRFILSWQFAFISDDVLVEVIFLAKDFSENKPLSGRLDLLDALSVLYCLFDKRAKMFTFDVRTYRRFVAVTKDAKGNVVEQSFTSKKAALTVSSRVDTVFEFPKEMGYLNICLLFHTGLVDITAFDTLGRDVVGNENLLDMVLKRLTSIHHGLASLREIKVYPRYQAVGNGHCRLFPVKLAIRDTLIQAPPKQGSLEQLGNSINVPKVSVPESTKAHMNDFLINNPVGYFEYASTDSVVTLLYCLPMRNDLIVPSWINL